MAFVKFGTCSWKYESWQGIIYPNDPNSNYLQEYSRHYSTVEVDQWFWSLFPKEVKLPGKEVSEYKNSIPEDFLFTIKVPNSLTLTHYYKSTNKNPYFLSVNLFEEFLETLTPLHNNIGCLMFQFEYMTKEKMNSLQEFQSKLHDFFSSVYEDTPPIAIETRNPNYLNEAYFRSLNDMNMGHAFLEGYFMPLVWETYSKNQKYIKNFSVIRLHGSDRSGIEAMSEGKWNKIYINRDNDLLKIRDMISDMRNRDINLYVNINNHYEGCAPITIKKLQALINEHEQNRD